MPRILLSSISYRCWHARLCYQQYWWKKPSEAVNIPLLPFQMRVQASAWPWVPGAAVQLTAGHTANVNGIRECVWSLWNCPGLCVNNSPTALCNAENQCGSMPGNSYHRCIPLLGFYQSLTSFIILSFLPVIICTFNNLQVYDKSDSIFFILHNCPHNLTFFFFARLKSKLGLASLMKKKLSVHLED